MEIGEIGFDHIGISCSKFHNQWASLLAEAKAVNSAAMVESVIYVCFLDVQEIAPPPNIKAQPLVEE